MEPRNHHHPDHLGSLPDVAPLPSHPGLSTVPINPLLSPHAFVLAPTITTASTARPRTNTVTRTALLLPGRAAGEACG